MRNFLPREFVLHGTNSLSEQILSYTGPAATAPTPLQTYIRGNIARINQGYGVDAHNYLPQIYGSTVDYADYMYMYMIVLQV